MGKSLIKVSAKIDVRRLENLGFNLLLDFNQEEEDEVLLELKKALGLCFFGLEKYCEGIKDPEYIERCSLIECVECDLYKQFVEAPEKFLYPLQTPKVNPNADTVIMHRDKTIDKNPYASLHDRIADGEDVKKFFGIRDSLRTNPVDYRADI